MQKINTFFHFLIALVWLGNGLFAKVLNMVPRHEAIVARILGSDYSSLLTKGIGVLEIGMFVWILSGIWRRLNMCLQIVVILIMNILETILVPDLLLWGRWNIVFAFLFCVFIFWNTNKLNEYN
ncbi:MAG: DoxX-like family protein [Bacteroidota bacterium]